MTDPQFDEFQAHEFILACIDRKVDSVIVALLVDCYASRGNIGYGRSTELLKLIGDPEELRKKAFEILQPTDGRICAGDVWKNEKLLAIATQWLSGNEWFAKLVKVRYL